MTHSQPISSFEFEREVRFVDTDVSGFAHCGAYIRMMEETEYAFLRSRGLSVVSQDELGTFGFPRLSSSLEIHEPLAFEQKVVVTIDLTEIDGKQITYQFKIFALPKNLRENPAVEGKFVVACCRFPADKPPYAILTPDHIIDALTAERVSS